MVWSIPSWLRHSFFFSNNKFENLKFFHYFFPNLSKYQRITQLTKQNIQTRIFHYNHNSEQATNFSANSQKFVFVNRSIFLFYRPSIGITDFFTGGIIFHPPFVFCPTSRPTTKAKHTAGSLLLRCELCAATDRHASAVSHGYSMM